MIERILTRTSDRLRACPATAIIHAHGIIALASPCLDPAEVEESGSFHQINDEGLSALPPPSGHTYLAMLKE